MTSFCLFFCAKSLLAGKDGVLDKLTRSIAEDATKREKEIADLHEKLKSDSNVVRKGAEQRLRILGQEDTELAKNKQRASMKRRTNKIQAEQRRLILQYDRKTAEGSDKRFQTGMCRIELVIDPTVKLLGFFSGRKGRPPSGLERVLRRGVRAAILLQRETEYYAVGPAYTVVVLS